MTKINLHGKLGEAFGENWELEVASVAEGLRALEANTGKFRKWIIDNLENFEYEIMINHKPLMYNKGESITVENYRHSDLCVEFKDKLKTIDIVPVVAGSRRALRSFGRIARAASPLLGGAAMLAGSFMAPKAAGFLIPAALSLISGGVTAMLSKPPPSIPYSDQAFVAQQATANKQSAIGGAGGNSGPISYLFSGPTNTVGEGGPVPVGYGELMVGGHNIATSYAIIYCANYRDMDATSLLETQKGFQFLFNEQCMLINQKPVNTNIS